MHLIFRLLYFKFNCYNKELEVTGFLLGPPSPLPKQLSQGQCSAPGLALWLHQIAQPG